MTDLAVTAANVLPSGTSPVVTDGVAGATITAGQVVYLDPTARQYFLSDSDSATAAVRQPAGIALNGASAGQPLRVQSKGDIVIGATMTAGLVYYNSKTAGGIAPLADIASGGYACTIGIAKSTTVLALGINYSGVAV